MELPRTEKDLLIGWLNKLKQSIKISGVNKLIINKCDILQNLNIYKILLDNEKDGPNFIKFINFENMKEYIQNELKDLCEIIFSYSKNNI